MKWGQLWGVLAAVTMLTATGCGSTASPSHSIKQGAKKTVSDTKKSSKKVDTAAKKAVSSAKNTKKPSKSSSAPTIPAGNIAAGSKLFASTCQVCHGKGGVGTSTAPRLAKPSPVASKFVTEPALEAFIAHNMPATSPGSLSRQQASNAAAYVWHIAGK